VRTQVKLSRIFRSFYVWGNATTGALGSEEIISDVQEGPGKLKNNLKPVTVSAGYGYTVFVYESTGEQVLYGCGLNTDRQLGPIEPRNEEIVRKLTRLIIPGFDGLQSVRSVSCGRAHSWIATKERKLYSFGHNDHGQCGVPVTENTQNSALNVIPFYEEVKQIACGLDHTIVLTEGGQVFSCGLGADGQTGDF